MPVGACAAAARRRRDCRGRRCVGQSPPRPRRGRPSQPAGAARGARPEWRCARPPWLPRGKARSATGRGGSYREDWAGSRGRRRVRPEGHRMPRAAPSTVADHPTHHGPPGAGELRARVSRWRVVVRSGLWPLPTLATTKRRVHRGVWVAVVGPWRLGRVEMGAKGRRRQGTGGWAPSGSLHSGSAASWSSTIACAPWFAQATSTKHGHPNS